MFKESVALSAVIVTLQVASSSWSVLIVETWTKVVTPATFLIEIDLWYKPTFAPSVENPEIVNIPERTLLFVTVNLVDAPSKNKTDEVAPLVEFLATNSTA